MLLPVLFAFFINLIGVFTELVDSSSSVTLNASRELSKSTSLVLAAKKLCSNTLPRCRDRGIMFAVGDLKVKGDSGATDTFGNVEVFN